MSTSKYCLVRCLYNLIFQFVYLYLIRNLSIICCTSAHCILYHGPDKRYSGRNICALFATTEIVLLNLDTLEEINVLRYENYGFVHGNLYAELEDDFFDFLISN